MRGTQAEDAGFSAQEGGYTAHRIGYWDRYNDASPKYEATRRYYRQRLIEVYRFAIPPGMRVLEVGCGSGDLLAGVRPEYGVGIDFSSVMLEQARAKHPHLKFIQMDAHRMQLNETFDFIICSDLVNELWDVQRVFEAVKAHSHAETRFLLNFHSNLWQGLRRIATALGLARPQLIQNWLTPEDIRNLLFLAGIEVIRTSHEVLWPFRTPFVDAFANRFLVKLGLIRQFGLTNVFIARTMPSPKKVPLVSVIVPARNEAGNVPAIFDRVPDMGLGTELIFVEGGSQDDTFGEIEKEMAKRCRPLTKLLRQEGKGKGDAVRFGFANAIGDVLMILDADLTVVPEDLPRFYDAWRSGRAEFVNGVRLVYPMEQRAMRFFNLLGNKFFSYAFSFLLGQDLKDTLCGTKVMSRDHYQLISADRAYFGDVDPFGDIELIFGAAKLNLKIVDMPIRYRERVAGESKMQRWRHGMVLLRLVALGLRRLKFV